MAKLGGLSVVLCTDPSSQLQNFFPLFSVCLEYLAVLKTGCAERLQQRRFGLSTNLSRVLGHQSSQSPDVSLVTQARQALDLSPGEGTETWGDGVPAPRPHTAGRRPLTLRCVSGETGQGRRMSGRGFPPCGNQSSFNCWPFLFSLPIKDISENIKKGQGRK